MDAEAVLHPAIDWSDGMAEAIPLGDGSADGVFCVLASHHLPDLETAIAEMVRIYPAGLIVWFLSIPGWRSCRGYATTSRGSTNAGWTSFHPWSRSAVF